MSLCNTYFGKEREDLTYQDIVDYFVVAKEESDKIEFKSFSDRETLKKQYDPVCRTISAFLNSAGGILIWGAPAGEKPEGRDEKIFEGDLEPINEVLEQDGLISKVSDLIEPLTNNIKVKILENEGTCVCVFEIDRDFHTAHQFRNTYYMRMDGQTRAAPHHYIEALMKQVKYPDLGGYLKVKTFGPDKMGIKVTVRIVIFNFSQFQNETNLTLALTSPQGIFQRTLSAPIDNRYSLDGHQFILENVKEILHFGSPFIHDESIIFQNGILDKNDFKAELVLNFGGKLSPMKISIYKLIFSGNVDLNNLDDTIVTERKENISMSEYQVQLGISKDKQIEKILGRKPE
jgi:schlafen family protein